MLKPLPSKPQSTSPLTPRSRAVMSYYANIDNGLVGKALRIFMPDAFYQRDDMPAMNGHRAITDFYSRLRPLRGLHLVSQNHVRESVLALANNTLLPVVKVASHFMGTHNGLPVLLRFRDWWVFHPESKNKVAYRQTWITPESSFYPVHRRAF